MNDTIAAIATALAPSAIGILRLSGPESVAVLDRVFTPAHGGPMSGRPDRALVYGALRDQDGQVLDYCLATVSRAPHSYTGEDTAELQCHGSPAALVLALEALFAVGARQAQAGEFTRRAFLAGKLDLTRTEAIADLIHAESPAAVRQAAGQLGGALAGAIEEIYQSLTDLMAHFHAVLDYPDEDIQPFQAAEISAALTAAGDKLDRLAGSYRRGRALMEGVPCAIIGRPNAGKSTLFNSLLGYDRAIVTPIAGTTRDTVEERLNLGGVLLRLIDTAGLREADDQVERLGVERSRAAVEQAELVLVVLDGSRSLTQEDREVLALGLSAPRCVVILNKDDLPGQEEAELPQLPVQVPVVRLSALTGDGVDQLELAMENLFPDDPGARPGALLTNARQVQAAHRARQAVSRAAQALRDGMPPDAVLSDVEQALTALGELTGRVVREDVTARIFERFCVGK
ncbi:MAG TPA: tRNA uridine-5-carboxymethylaminomethyl(34) synthesis GTPase MnmE [Candidatus Enterenecus stercoripullorum]|nr:tRNA uridine-5-carboxymethylaminomethyl(34) synthesis GTPase MnmE [Candidatus Enterenecus stercoripullorum]